MDVARRNDPICLLGKWYLCGCRADEIVELAPRGMDGGRWHKSLPASEPTIRLALIPVIDYLDVPLSNGSQIANVVPCPSFDLTLIVPP